MMAKNVGSVCDDMLCQVVYIIFDVLNVRMLYTQVGGSGRFL